MLHGSPCWPLPALHHAHTQGLTGGGLYSRGPSGTLHGPHTRHSSQDPTAQPPGASWPGNVRLWRLFSGLLFLEQSQMSNPSPFSVAPDNGCHWGKLLSPLSSSSGVCGGLGPGRTFSRGALPGVAVCYWLPCLSCWYTLCPWMACSSKGRFIPSTQVSTRAFTREPPSERHKSQGAPGISATLQVHPGRSPSARLVLSLTRRA